MRPTRTVEFSTGLFVLLGFAALFFLVTQITNRELSVNGKSYEVVAMFENIGSLKPGAAVSMAGVTVGRVERIGYDQQQYKAVVRMRINSQFDRIPTDSDASIMTSGLLGGQYIGITPGGAEEFLKQGDRIEFVQDAFVLENLINQLASTFLRRDQGSADGGNQGGDQEKRRQRSRSDEAFSQSVYQRIDPRRRGVVAAARRRLRAPPKTRRSSGPQELVTKVAQDTLRDLDAHRSEYKKNPNRVRELVDKNMLPHFDTAYAAQLVLAKHWRTATPSSASASSKRSISRCCRTTARRCWSSRPTA